MPKIRIRRGRLLWWVIVPYELSGGSMDDSRPFGSFELAIGYVCGLLNGDTP